MSRKPAPPIPVADLLADWSLISIRGTEWLYRAKADLERLLGEVYCPHRADLAARLEQITHALDERMIRTLTDLPDLYALRREGVYPKGRVE